MGRLSRGATEFLNQYTRNEQVMLDHRFECPEGMMGPITFAAPAPGIHVFRHAACRWFKWEDRRGSDS